MSGGIIKKARAIWAKIAAVSLPFREFLETSTLHGLVYISKAESFWGKFLWTVSVIVSFSLAGVLINQSFVDWSTHPVSSVISTHPIKDLRFPNVTVCPPKGSNTALNYDLFQLKSSFSSLEKGAIAKQINAIFLEKPTEMYTKTLLDLVNGENLINIYRGFHTIPTHSDDKKEYTVRVSGQSGKIFAISSEKHDTVHYILKLPENLRQLIGETGILIVEVTLDSESSTLKYREGPKYVVPRWDPDLGEIGKTWQEAADQCKGMGGKLPSMKTEQDNNELMFAIQNKGDGDLGYWIGGRNDGNWSWVDGSDIDVQDWRRYSNYPAAPEGEKPLCLYFDVGAFVGSWYALDCDRNVKMSYVCELGANRLNGIGNTLSYQKNHLPRGSLQFWWKSVKNETMHVMSTETLSLSWKIENDHSNLELVSRNMVGHVKTPDFGKHVATEFYMKDRSSNFILELPDNLEDMIGDSRLVVNLHVDTRASTGWKEGVQYSDGSNFKYYPEKKTWQAAENSCSNVGTHLASVTSWRERNELMALGEKQLWIGGFFNGNWTWIDGEKWEVTMWDEDRDYPKQESRNTKLAFYETGLWRNYFPRATFPFVCKTTMNMKGVHNRTFEYTAKDLKNTSKITVQWAYQFSGEDVLTKWERPRRTGFNISWSVEGADGMPNNIAYTGEEIWTSKLDMEAIFTDDNVHFVAFVNMAQQALENNYDHVAMLKELREKIASYKLGDYSRDCQYGQTTAHVFRKFSSEFQFSYDTKIHMNVSTLALQNGFELYSTLLHCPSQKHVDLFLQDFFLNFTSPRDLLQGASNMIKSQLLTNPENIDHFYQFCRQMQSILGLNLEDVLYTTLMSSDIAELKMKKYPFFLYKQNSTPNQGSSIGAANEGFAAELSSHPVHLVTKEGKTLPSAFIPFCAYQTDLLMLGQNIKGLKFPVCNKFTPTVLDGQLCYTLDIRSVLPNTDALEGKDGQLLLLLDYNKERSIGLKRTNSVDDGDSERYISMRETLSDEDQEARIFIHTLKAFSGFGAGSYSMSSLKQMTLTENFQELPTSTAGCANKQPLFSHGCTMKKYLKQKVHDCGCIPLEFLQNLNLTKVR